MKNMIKAATDSLAQAQAYQEEYANRQRRHEAFEINDMVLFSTAHIQLDSQSRRPTKKL
jgi:hypothetical protein